MLRKYTTFAASNQNFPVMKKKFSRSFLCSSLTILLMLTISPLKGEETFSAKHHIEFSIGEPLTSAWGFNGMFTDNQTEYQIFEQWAGKSRPYTLPKGVKGYENEWIIPTFSLCYYYRPLKWLEVGSEVSTMSMCMTENYLADDKVYAYYLHSNLYIAAGARFNYFHKHITDLYSGFTIGANIRFHTTESTPLLLATARFTWQITALGVRFGKRVYGNVEIGYGYKGMLSAGVGYRF